MKVYIGVSKYLGVDAMANVLEVDYDTHEAKVRSCFERVLGADYIRPEDFEIYDRKDYPGETFDNQFIKRLLPIPSRRLNLDTLDFSEIRSVFFLQNAGSLRSGPDGFIEIVDSFEQDDNTGLTSSDSARLSTKNRQERLRAPTLFNRFSTLEKTQQTGCLKDTLSFLYFRTNRLSLEAFLKWPTL